MAMYIQHKHIRRGVGVDVCSTLYCTRLEHSILMLLVRTFEVFKMISVNVSSSIVTFDWLLQKLEQPFEEET